MEESKHFNTPILQHSNSIEVGIITISDRASGGQYEDLGGPAVKAASEKRGWDGIVTRISNTLASGNLQGTGSGGGDLTLGTVARR